MEAVSITLQDRLCQSFWLSSRVDTPKLNHFVTYFEWNSILHNFEKYQCEFGTAMVSILQLP